MLNVLSLIMMNYKPPGLIYIIPEVMLLLFKQV